jgi:hypothetical protein
MRMKRINIKSSAVAVIWMGVSLVSALPHDSLIPGSSSGNIVKNFTYSNEDGTYVKVLGVASISMDRIQCWDCTGKQSDSLVERVKAIIDHAMLDIDVKMNRKVRYVILETDRGMRYYRWSTADKNNEKVGYMRVSKSHLEGLLEIQAPTDKKEIDLIASLGTYEYRNSIIPCSLGTKTLVRGHAFEYGGSTTYKEWLAKGYRGEVQDTGKMWVIQFSHTCDSTALDISYPYVMLDLNKRPIYYVDDKGKPVSVLTALSTPLTVSETTNSKLRKFQSASVNKGWAGEVIESLITNIDPQYVGFVLLKNYQPIEKLLIGFDHIPLEPKE